MTWLGYSLGMGRDEAIIRLRANADRLRSFGVRHLALFGSTARDEASATSDVDLLVDHKPKRLGLIELAGLTRVASEILQAPADVALREGLRPSTRATIEAEALEVF